MGFFRDPVWQFIGVVVALVGILVALIALVNPLAASIVFIAALIVLILLYPKLRPNKTIFFRILSDTTVLSIKEKEEAKEVQIQYKGEEVKEDIQLVLVRLWNASSDPILPNDYKVNHIKMSFGKEAKVLSAQVLESKPPTIKEEIDDNKLIEFADGEIYLKPIWLNTDNSLTLKVLLTMFQGYVSTDETRIILGGYVRDWNRSGYSKLKQVLDTVLKPVILCISIIMFFLIFYLLESITIYFWKVDILAKNAPPQLTIITLFIIVALIVICVAMYYFLLDYSKKLLSRIFN
jgi:hypothetical protein